MERANILTSGFPFIRNHVKLKIVKLEYCNSTEQMADIFTKDLPTNSFTRLRAKLGIKIISV